tara:strand:- start:79 stop:759 length:681 start_codon:yes stop_codon:yes gene_type:complete
MSLHPRNSSTNRFPIFQELNPDYNNHSLLDFGGNRGNLLHFSEGTIPSNRYTCVDVSSWSVFKGEEEFPDANFIHYNRYNEMYNPSGNSSESFPTVDQHDYVWAFSVFSHMKYEDILETLQWMRTINASRILASYICNDGDENSRNLLEYFYQKRINEFGSSVDFRENDDSKFYVTDNQYGDFSGTKFISVFNTESLKERLSYEGIVVNKITSSLTAIPFLEISYV